jgi:hypothetical protein
MEQRRAKKVEKLKLASNGERDEASASWVA